MLGYAVIYCGFYRRCVRQQQIELRRKNYDINKWVCMLYVLFDVFSPFTINWHSNLNRNVSCACAPQATTFLYAIKRNNREKKKIVLIESEIFFFFILCLSCEVAVARVNLPFSDIVDFSHWSPSQINRSMTQSTITWSESRVFSPFQIIIDNKFVWIY